MNAPRYVIWTPPQGRSNGPRVLHALYNVLKARGREVFLFCPEEQRQEYAYLDRLDARTREEDIVVYPEIVRGNPLRFRKVVRYVLYYPGRLGFGTETFFPEEQRFVWDIAYDASPQLILPVLDTSLFYDAGLPRTHDSMYIHKGGEWRDMPELEGCVRITQSWPSTRQELAHLLQTTKTLYSFDAKSMLNVEAMTCGAQVKIILKDGMADCADYPLGYSAEATDPLVEQFFSMTRHMPSSTVLEIYPLTFVEWVNDRFCLPAALFLVRLCAAVSRSPRLRALSVRLDGLLKRHGRGDVVVTDAGLPARLRAELKTAWRLLGRDWAALRGAKGESSFNLLHRIWSKCRMKCCGAQYAG